MSDLKPCTEIEHQCVQEICQRISADLSMIADRDLVFDEITVERMDHRPAGNDRIHISFKMSFQFEHGTQHGCVLMPLPEAIALACYLMLVPDETVAARRKENEVDSSTKDAILEIGNFIGSATYAAIKALGMEDCVVRSSGCQGVRADVRPALPYTEGDALIVGRARAVLHGYPEFEMILILPDIGESLAARAE